LRSGKKHEEARDFLPPQWRRRRQEVFRQQWDEEEGVEEG